MARILVVSYSPIASDPRVLRQIDELNSDHDVTVAGFGTFEHPGVTYKELPSDRSQFNRLTSALRLSARQFLAYDHALAPARSLRELACLGSFDLYIANDIDCLPAVLDIANGSSVLLDLHEYFLDMTEPEGLRRRLFSDYHQWLCRTYIPHASLVTTVSDAIADAYARDLGIDTPTVIPNAARFVDQRPSLVDEEKVQLVHHGCVTPTRGIDILIDAVLALSSRYVLHLYLVSSPQSISALKQRSSGSDRVIFHEPVPTRKLPVTLNAYDVGVFAAQPSNFSVEHSLPNKFFESVQARLAQVTTPVPTIRSMLENLEIGHTTPGFSQECVIEGLLGYEIDAIRDHKERTDVVALSLSWETYAPIFHSIVARGLS